MVITRWARTWAPQHRSWPESGTASATSSTSTTTATWAHRGKWAIQQRWMEAWSPDIEKTTSMNTKFVCPLQIGGKYVLQPNDLLLPICAIISQINIFAKLQFGRFYLCCHYKEMRGASSTRLRRQSSLDQWMITNVMKFIFCFAPSL